MMFFVPRCSNNHTVTVFLLQTDITGEILLSVKIFKMADDIYQKMGYKTEENCTWHHIPQSTQLMLVPTKIHELVDHTGGVSMSLGE